METLIKNWPGESVICHFDKPTSTWMFLAIHSTKLGIAAGGTRLKSYPQARDALQDAMKLAEGMTYKCALANLKFGGGKVVLAVPEDFDQNDREGLMERYGKWLTSLGGIIETSGDFGTNVNDLLIMARHYDKVRGLPSDNIVASKLGYATALGVFSGIQTGCKHVFGTDDLSGKTVLVQGVGAVGGELVRLLLDGGCNVKFSEVSSTLIAKFRDEKGLTFIEPHAVYLEPCDVYAPCATGGILNAETIPQLKAKIVAGAANNQLSTVKDADALREKGILYAPDYVINAGAVIWAIVVEHDGCNEGQAMERVQSIGKTLDTVIKRSDDEDLNLAKVAEIMAKELLH